VGKRTTRRLHSRKRKGKKRSRAGVHVASDRASKKSWDKLAQKDTGESRYEVEKVDFFISSQVGAGKANVTNEILDYFLSGKRKRV